MYSNIPKQQEYPSVICLAENSKTYLDIWMQKILYFALFEIGCNIHPFMQDSYNLNVTIFNQPIEYQMLMATSAIEARMNLNILLVKMARSFCNFSKCFHKR